ncbi:hypothetical protein Q1695_012936 [Nippostrongylus brasiliensis]|nr:hypothetical protein Q1695_012936 [Nippostrongylus brasiliensis]
MSNPGPGSAAEITSTHPLLPEIDVCDPPCTGGLCSSNYRNQKEILRYTTSFFIRLTNDPCGSMKENLDTSAEKIVFQPCVEL